MVVSIMQTGIDIKRGTASQLEIDDGSVDLIVTSPPYPMVEMWDGIFTQQSKRISSCLSTGRGREAFQLMHEVLDRAWGESYRVLKNGGIACINIGDATRTLNGDFQLYSNHSRILNHCLDLGFAALPDILWRKPTNAPTKFMGSGMLPVGAYVTYEHEYILVLRKGTRRQFKTAKEKENRRKSAYFWEERNRWFSDIWFDIRGTEQDLFDTATRQRSAAFPYELAHRLICMFSIGGDRVLDPFAGTGTTLAASVAAGRNAVGIEIDKGLIPTVAGRIGQMQTAANAYNRDRIQRHAQFVTKRIAEKGPLKYANIHYGFPVVTGQEQELLIPAVETINKIEEFGFAVSYFDAPQPDCLRASAAKKGQEQDREKGQVK